MLGDDMRLAGAVNLLTSYPPLASAILVARYSWSPWREAELRGWPGQVVELVREVLARAPEPLVEEVLARASSSGWFAANYADMVYHDVAKGVVSAEAAYNYLRGLADFGSRLYRWTLCITTRHAEALASLGGAGLDDIRRADLAFIARVYPDRDDDEPEQSGAEEYACSPQWALGAAERLAALLAEKAPRGARLSAEVDALASRLETTLREDGRRAYAFARAVVHAGPVAAWGLRNALEAFEGRITGVKGLVDLEPGLPAVNYAAAPLALMAFQSLEAPRLAFYASEMGLRADRLEWDGSVGGFKTPNGVLAVPEAVATAVAAGYHGRLLVPREGAGEALRLLEAARARAKAEEGDNVITVDIEGYG